MSETKTSPHILRRVREVLGLSREKLAKLLGCSAVYLKKIESGASGMSPALASVIMRETAADPTQLLKDDGKEPRDIHGEILSQASRENAIRRTRQIALSEVDRYVEKLRMRIELYLDAALMAPDNRFQNVLWDIHFYLNGLDNKYELGPFARRLLDEYGIENPPLGAESPWPKGKKRLIAVKRRARYEARLAAFKEPDTNKLELPPASPDSSSAAASSAKKPRVRAPRRSPQPT